MQHFLPSWFSSTFLHFPSLLPILIFIPKIFQRLSPFSVFWFHRSLHSQHNYCLCLASRAFIIIEEKCKTKSTCLCGQMLNWALKESTFGKILAYFESWDVIRGNEIRNLLSPCPNPTWITQCTQFLQPPSGPEAFPTTATHVLIFPLYEHQLSFIVCTKQFST